jgi:hypothetical protein
MRNFGQTDKQTMNQHKEGDKQRKKESEKEKEEETMVFRIEVCSN